MLLKSEEFTLNKIKYGLSWLKASSTFNTWLSYSTKALSLFIVLPLILKKFTSGEVALWYLFSSVIALQGLADMGFKHTFVRFISFAMGGAKDINVYNSSKHPYESSGPNWDLISKIYSNMKKVYVWLTLLFFLLLISMGSLAMIKPVMVLSNPHEGWLCWGVIILVSCFKFYGTIFSNFLEGLNQVSLVKRWEAITSIFSIITSILFLILFDSLFALVLANQTWVLVNVLKDSQLCRKVENGAFLKLRLDSQFDKEFFRKIWQPAWRGGLSGFMSNGLNNITSILYAQIGSTTNIASYLLALRLMAQVKEVSMAPFYSKIPYLAKLRSQGRSSELVKVAQKGMFLSNIVFVIGSIIIGVLAEYFLGIIGSEVNFVEPQLWVLITIAYFIHRYGAMHIQLYNTTNHIIAHIADGVSGMIYIITVLMLINKYELYAIPVGMIAGYLGFYSWYAASFSLRSLETSFFKFEKKSLLIPLLIFLIYIFSISDYFI